MVLFTTLAGAGQGVLIALFGVQLAAALGLGAAPPTCSCWPGAALVLLLCGAGLVAATFHLGRPLRAWRAGGALAHLLAVARDHRAAGVHGGGGRLGPGASGWARPRSRSVPWPASAGARAVPVHRHDLRRGEDHPRMGHAADAAQLRGAGHRIGLDPGRRAGRVAMPPLAAAAGVAPRWPPPRWASSPAAPSWWRNDSLQPADHRCSPPSACATRASSPKSPGMMAGSFNSREFFHGRSARFVRDMRWAAALLGFLLPLAALALAGGRLGAGGAGRAGPGAAGRAAGRTLDLLRRRPASAEPLLALAVPGQPAPEGSRPLGRQSRD